MEGAVPPGSLQRSLLDYLDLLQCELQQTVLHLLQPWICTPSALLANVCEPLSTGLCESLRLTNHDLYNGYCWLLHTRFPAVRTLAISDVDSWRPWTERQLDVQEDHLADFAVRQSKLLQNLVDLDLSKCSKVTSASATRVASCCQQLDSLILPGSSKHDINCDSAWVVAYEVSILPADG
jgi:hypothetical protein